MARTSKLNLSRETIQVLDAAPASAVSGAYPTSHYIASSCTTRPAFAPRP